MAAKWTAINRKEGVSCYPRFWACLPPCWVYSGSDSNAAASLLTKLFILVLSVENNKTWNPGRAGEPYVPRSLFSKSGFASFSPKALTFGPSCLLPHSRGSCVIMDRDYWVLVGRRRPQLIIRGTKTTVSLRVACWIATWTHLSYSWRKKKKTLYSTVVTPGGAEAGLKLFLNYLLSITLYPIYATKSNKIQYRLQSLC